MSRLADLLRTHNHGGNMPTLRFEGYSDDTFGEVLHTKDDYDNCASGEPIQYLVSADAYEIVVTGQFCPGHSGSWLIGVANYDPECLDRDLPPWPIRFEAQSDRFRHSPALIIEAPEGVEVECLTRFDNRSAA